MWTKKLNFTQNCVKREIREVVSQIPDVGIEAWERQSPDWRWMVAAKRKSGDWRSQERLQNRRNEFDA